MELSRNRLNTSDRRGLQTPLINSSENPVLLPALESLPWKSTPPWAVPPPQASSRCLEKGCVFPAAFEGRCLQHERQAREPILFSSHQPTHVVLEQGKFGFPQSEIDDGSRIRDRRKLAALRESLLEG
jgi:hypothetical protein